MSSLFLQENHPFLQMPAFKSVKIEVLLAVLVLFSGALMKNNINAYVKTTDSNQHNIQL